MFLRCTARVISVSRYNRIIQNARNNQTNAADQSQTTVSQERYRILHSTFPNVEQPSGNLVSTVFRNVSRWGSKTAMECSITGQSYTYNQLMEGISKWARFLSERGLQKGDMVAVYMPNCPQYPIVVLGAMSIGLIVTMGNPRYTKDEIRQHLNQSCSMLVVTLPSLAEIFVSLLAEGRPNWQLVTNGPTNLEGATNLLDVLQDDTYPYSDILEVPNETTAVLPFSSGTTGKPKGVQMSHGAISINLLMLSQPPIAASPMSTDSFQDTYLCLPPFYHMFGTMVMLWGLQNGSKLVTFPAFDPKLYVDTIKKKQAEILHLVPTVVNFLIHSPLAPPNLLESLKTMIISAAPFSPSEAEAFKNKFGRDIFMQELFGMSEALITNLVPLAGERIGTSGKLLSNVSAKIIDTSTGRTLEPQECGEICIRTPAIMSGYFQNAQLTAETIDKDGFFHTGDVGFFDEDGYLKIVDRTKDLIKVKGLQVSPSEVEDVIRQHPKVADVGVIGVPHERLGEAPKAYIVAKDDITAEDDIHRFLASRVAPHKRLVGGISFVRELPRSPVGKLLRKELRID